MTSRTSTTSKGTERLSGALNRQGTYSQEPPILKLIQERFDELEASFGPYIKARIAARSSLRELETST